MTAEPTRGDRGLRPTPAAGGIDAPALEPGTVFGKYEIVRVIGVGGMGCVYEAQHSLLRKRVALKTLHPQLTAHFDFRARFLREGETLARIRHPNVVDISDVGVHDGLTYLVMEYLEGESLFALLGRERFLDERRIANLMLPLIDGLGAAHAAGVVHRDIKPENIFLARDAKGEIRPKLLDFGISKVEGTPASMALTSGGGVLGTPLYMSPEQARGSASVDWRSDQYGLGVVLYECATGALPFHHAALLDQMNAIVSGVYEHPCAVRPEISDALAELIIQAMALDPAGRFDPLDALGRALLPFAGSRVRSYYEAVFAEEGPAPESIRPPLPTFDAVSGVITLPPVLTPPRTPRMVVPPSGAAAPTPRPAPMTHDDAATEARMVSHGVRAVPSAHVDAGAVERPRRRPIVAIALGAILLLGVVCGGVWLATRDGTEAQAQQAAPPATTEALPVTAPSAAEEPRTAVTAPAIVTAPAARVGGVNDTERERIGSVNDTEPAPGTEPAPVIEPEPDTIGDVRDTPSSPREARRRNRPAVVAPTATPEPPPSDPRDIRLTR